EIRTPGGGGAPCEPTPVFSSSPGPRSASGRGPLFSPARPARLAAPGDQPHMVLALRRRLPCGTAVLLQLLLDPDGVASGKTQVSVTGPLRLFSISWTAPLLTPSSSAHFRSTRLDL